MYTNVKPRAVRLAVIIAFLALAASLQFSTRADALEQKSPARNPFQATEQNIALGLDHYTAHCAVCHGDFGKADTQKGKAVGAANLTLYETQSKSDPELFQIISKGVRGSAMPAFGKTHKQTEIWHTILFLRRLPTLTPEEKKKLEATIPAGARHKHPAQKKSPDHNHDEETSEQSKTGEAHHQPEAASPPQKQSQPAGTQQPTPSQHQHQETTKQTQKDEKPQSADFATALALSELEQMALENNPTLAQADAAIRVAEGKRKQAGLFPNPIIGYQGEELSTRAFSEKSEHFFFVEQTILTGGKLKKSRRIFEHEQTEATAEREAQRQRVLNSVRLLYYEALAADERIELRKQLARLANEAVKISEELFNIGQADRPDLLEAEVEAQQVELALINAENEREKIWQMMAAVVGNPALKPARLAGDLEAAVPALDREALLVALIGASPEIKSARARVERARAVIDRAKAERSPDIFLRGGFGYSSEKLEGTNRATGPEGFIEAGIRIPLFNRNQGNVAAAQAELLIAERDIQRLELSLRARLSDVFAEYSTSLRAVERFQQRILPRAQKAYELYLTSFRQMAAAYPQVLIAQRTMFQVREEYIVALARLHQNAIRLQGFLLTGGLDAPAMRGSGIEEQGASDTRDR